MDSMCRTKVLDQLSSFTHDFTRNLSSAACAKIDALCKTKQEATSARNSIMFLRIFPQATPPMQYDPFSWTPMYEATKRCSSKEAQPPTAR